jgi:HTH-type transcriptional regulator/antitoxin HipB
MADPHDIHDSRAFGAAIRRARRESQLTQEDVALAAGVGVRFVVDLERGKPTAQLELALRVGRAVGLHVSLSA